MSREYNKEEKISCVAEYQDSGMSIAEFAREKRIPASTLRSWIRLNTRENCNNLTNVFS